MYNPSIRANLPAPADLVRYHWRQYRLGVPVAPYYAPSEVFTSPQQRERDFYAQVDHPETGSPEHTGAPFQFSKTPTMLTRTPLLGEHNADVYCGLLGYAVEELSALGMGEAV